MRPAWTVYITFASTVLFFSLAWADFIGLVSQGSQEVACYSPAFHGYVDAYRDGKFRVFRVLEGCAGERSLPKACEPFVRLPKEGVPSHVKQAIPRPESHRYLYHEFWEQDINIIAFDEVYGDPCPQVEVQPVPKPRVPPPAIFSSPQLRPFHSTYLAALSEAKEPSWKSGWWPEGQPLPDYSVQLVTSAHTTERGITTGDRIPITGPEGKVEAQLSGKRVVLAVDRWNAPEGRSETYFLEGPVIVDKSRQEGVLEVSKIWLVAEKQTPVVERMSLPSASLGAIVEIEEHDKLEQWPWHLNIQGVIRFFPAEIGGIRFQDGRRVVRIRVTSEAKQQLGQNPVLMRVIRRSQ
jgi:hypothetical protein